MAKPIRETVKTEQESGVQDIKLSPEETKLEIAKVERDQKQELQSQAPVNPSYAVGPTSTDSFAPIKTSPGLRRHKLVVASCVGVALLFVGMSSFDLNPLITKKVILNESLRLNTARKLPELPSNLAYADLELESTGYDATTLIPVKPNTWGSQRYGFVDWSGQVVVKPQYESYRDTSEGMTAVASGEKENERWGYLDKTGKLVIPAKYSDAQQFDHGVATVTKDDETLLIDKTGKVLFSSPVRETPRRLGKGNLYIISQQNGKTGLINSNGQWTLKPTYDRIEGFENMAGFRNRSNLSNPSWTLGGSGRVTQNYFRIWSDNLCGIIDADGQIIIPPKYKNIVSFANGHAAVEIDKKIGFVDTSGKIIIEPKYDYVTQFDKLIAVRNGKKWRIIDESGKKLPFPHLNGVITNEEGHWLFNGLGVVIVDGLCGYSNEQAQIVIPPKFLMALPFHGAYAPVWNGNAWQYINAQGNPAIQQNFSDIGPFENGIAKAEIPGILYQLVENSNIAQKNFRFKTALELVSKGKNISGSYWATPYSDRNNNDNDNPAPEDD